MVVTAVAGAVGGALVSRFGKPSSLTTLGEISPNVAKTAPEILSKASKAVGDQFIRAANRKIAEQAAKEWVGEGAKPIVERSTGEQVGWKNFDGTKIARFTSINKAAPYINLINKITGGNLHVSF
jgi:hypothetical protein